MRVWVWLLAAAAIAGAQNKPAATSILTSDGQPAAAAGAAEMLQAVCPGNVMAGKGISCKGACPEETGFAGTTEPDGWWVSAVTRGHFLSATSDDAALAMAGCEPHAANFGGTVLLTRQGGRWTKRWYKSGVMTDECHKVAAPDGHDLLVCTGGWTGQGINAMSLFLMDLHAKDPSQEADYFFRAEDSMGACGGMDSANPEPVVSASLDKVEFLSRKISGLPVISVTASYGKKPMKAGDWQACMDGKMAAPAEKTYQIEYQFDGNVYKPAAASAAAAKLFEAQ